MRYLLVDRILECKKGESAVGVKNVCQTEDFFSHHFPDYPVMPGALTVEAMAQTAGRLICATVDFKQRPMLLEIQSARFRTPIYPGDQMLLQVRLTGMSDQIAEVQGKVQVNGNVAAEAKLKFFLGPISDDAALNSRRQYEQLVTSRN